MQLAERQASAAPHCCYAKDVHASNQDLSSGPADPQGGPGGRPQGSASGMRHLPWHVSHDHCHIPDAQLVYKQHKKQTHLDLGKDKTH